MPGVLYRPPRSLDGKLPTVHAVSRSDNVPFSTEIMISPESQKNERLGALKRRLHAILFGDEMDAGIGRLISRGIQMLILLNIIAVIVETVGPIQESFGWFFTTFELVSVSIFLAEYAARVWVCTVDPRFRRGFTGRVRYAATPLALVDLVAILPAFLTFIPFDLRILRILRLFRAAKLVRHSVAMQTLMRVMSATRQELALTFMLVAFLLVLASSVMYFVENPAQPELFSSIPAAMWWAVATLTTVGYGDIYPVTLGGKIVASVISILGIGLFALPTGILGAAFLAETNRQKSQEGKCPHCGRTSREPS